MHSKDIVLEDIKSYEVLNYYKYLAKETEYITMHKTKGSNIPSVIVVMKEFYWNEYNFSSVYSSDSDSNIERISNSRKLIYVACSRAQNFLACVKMLKSTEVDVFIQAFPNAELVEI